MKSDHPNPDGFVRAHARLVRHVAHIYGRGADDREDLAQEILLQLWRSRHRYDGRSRESTWAYRVALNVAISFLSNRCSILLSYGRVLPRRVTRVPIGHTPAARICGTHVNSRASTRPAARHTTSMPSPDAAAWHEAHLGLPEEPPSSTPARAPPLLDFARRPPGDAVGYRQS